MREHLPRGVWKAPWQRDGYDVALAVDSQRREIATVVLRPGIDRTLVKRYLTALLDMADPHVTLELIASGGERLPRSRTQSRKRAVLNLAK